jgi:hypothetical protein
MKHLFTLLNSGLTSPNARTLLSLLLTPTLGAGLWIVTPPAALATLSLTPAEMIQEGLPHGKTMKKATKTKFLSAVCAAVQKHREAAPEIANVAVAAHREYAGDIIATALRCSPSLDCAFAGVIVTSAVHSAPGDASIIDDAALSVAPDCSDAIKTGRRPAARH